jgi:rod shape-determining protein MreD
MTPARAGLTVVVVIILAIVIQTTVFARFSVVGVSPDLVMLMVILVTLRFRPEPAMLVGFTAGLALDALGSAPLGLRASVLTVVAFAASRTRDRADYSPLAAAVWVGLLTAVGSLLIVIVGTLVGELGLGGREALRRILLVPLFTFVVALALWPVLARLIEPARRAL